jgi:hypothetical protein
MTKKARSDATDPLGEPVTEKFKHLCTFALQLALEAAGAPDRCRSRACRETGRCHCEIAGDAPLCHAGPIPGPVGLQAATMVTFLYEVAG